MRSPFFLYGFFAVIGLPCLLMTLFFTFSSIQKLSSWQTAEGVIVTHDSTEYPTITFKYGGESHEVSAGYNGDDLISGHEVTVYFPEDHPEQAEIKSFFSVWFTPLFLALFGVTFGGIGLYGIIAQIKRLKAKKELFTEQRGKKLSGLRATVTLNTSYKVNGRSPYVIIAHWTDPITQIDHRFKSENLWDDPTPRIHNDKVDVYIDESDLRRYYVDVTFLEPNS